MAVIIYGPQVVTDDGRAHSLVGRLRQMAVPLRHMFERRKKNEMAKAPSSSASAKTTEAKAAPKRGTTARKPAVKPTPLKSEPETLTDQATSFAKNAGDKAREYANTGKDKASDALGGLSGLFNDLAKTVDEKIGTQYGDYTRKAADAVDSAADTLKGKSIDDIAADTRNFVREKPMVALGAAAAVGFVLTRLFRAGSGDRDA